MQNETIVIAVVAGLVLVWYLVEWIVTRERGKKLPLVLDPLRVLVVALGRVWRQRTLLLVLLGFWVGSQLVSQLVTDPLINDPQRARMGIGGQMPVGEGLAGRWRMMMTHGIGWSEAVHYSVPRFLLVRVTRQDTLVVTALCLALAMVFWRLRREQPEWLGKAGRLPLGLFAVLNAAVVVLIFVLRVWGMRYDSYRSMPLLLEIASHAGLALVLAATVPLTATVWHLLLQVVREEACSCALAVRTALQVWKPALWYVLLVFSPMFMMPLLGRVAMVWPSVWGVLSGWYLLFVLLFVPLIIVDRRVGLWDAGKRHFELVAKSWGDMFAFAVRVMALMLPLRLLLSVLQIGPTAGWLEGARDVLGEVVGLLVAVWVVGWFLVYRDGEERYLAGAREGDGVGAKRFAGGKTGTDTIFA